MLITNLIVTQSNIFHSSRSLETPIAWRDKDILTLRDFKMLVTKLSYQICTYPQMRWALCCKDSYYFAAGLLALIHSNKTPILLGHMREPLLQTQMDEFDALLADIDFDLACPILMIPSIDQSDDATADGFVLPPYPSDSTLVLFTSGSTGKPKPISKSMRLLERESQLLAAHFGDEFVGSIIVSTISHQHLYGLTFRILLPLYLGLPFDANMIQYQEQLNALMLARIPTKGETHSSGFSLLSSFSKTTLISSPAFLKRLDNNLANILCDIVISSGGPLSVEAAEQAQECLGTLPVEIYGSSEMGVIARCVRRQSPKLWRALAPIYLTQIGVDQCRVASPLFDESTDPVLSDNVRMDINSQEFYLLGRQDRIVKIEEKRISLSEVENRLLEFEWIQDSAVIVLDQDGRVALGAVVVLSPEGRNQQIYMGFKFNQHLRLMLSQYLEAVAIPKRWRFVDYIPQNTQSKRAYFELQGLFV